MSILFQYLIALLQWQSVCGTWNILEFVQGSRLSCFLVPWKRNDIHRVNKLNNPFQINLPSDATKDPLFSNRWDELSGPKEQSCLMGSGRIPGPVSTVTNLPKTLCEIRLMGHRWTQSRAVVYHLAPGSKNPCKLLFSRVNQALDWDHGLEPFQSSYQSLR